MNLFGHTGGRVCEMLVPTERMSRLGKLAWETGRVLSQLEPILQRVWHRHRPLLAVAIEEPLVALPCDDLRNVAFDQKLGDELVGPAGQASPHRQLSNSDVEQVRQLPRK